MDERDIRALIGQVRCGALPRRSFIRQMAAWGIAAPMASMLLAHEGVAQVQGSWPAYRPTRRGGGGTLKVLAPQAAVHLNPHLATGRKEHDAIRLFYEPLAAWGSDGSLLPVLAAEVPSRANGGVAADGRSVTWKLKPGVTWHDGRPFTADDVVFTWEYCKEPSTSAATVTTYADMKVERVDAHTVRLVFPRPTPFWAEQFTGLLGPILPRHIFASYIGAKSREAPHNIRPVGTGPYRFVDFRPGDMLRGELNPDYHMPNRPHFDAIEVKGGGDVVSAARAVMQVGEYDYAPVGGIEDDILRRLEDGGKGRAVIVEVENTEHILLNASDPWTEVDGERGSARSRHPVFSDKSVRDAVALLVDRKSIQEVLYGRLAAATANFLNYPVQYRSPALAHEFNIARASQLLDSAGWARGAGGLRAKAGIPLRLVFVTSVAASRQKAQAIVKDAFTKAGIDVELKAVTPSVFFGGDSANPDYYKKFWADMLMYTFPGITPDPQFAMGQFCSWNMAQKANHWASLNLARWKNDEYDRAWLAAQAELDPVRRTALFVRMNEFVCADRHVIPLFSRRVVAAVGNGLVAPLSAWDVPFATLPHWYRQA